MSQREIMPALYSGRPNATIDGWAMTVLSRSKKAASIGPSIRPDPGRPGPPSGPAEVVGHAGEEPLAPDRASRYVRSSPRDPGSIEPLVRGSPVAPAARSPSRGPGPSLPPPGRSPAPE